MEAKKSYLSKTYWTNFIVAGVTLVSPEVAQWIAENPQLSILAFAGVNALLRKYTKAPIQMW